MAKLISKTCIEINAIIQVLFAINRSYDIILLFINIMKKILINNKKIEKCLPVFVLKKNIYIY